MKKRIVAFLLAFCLCFTYFAPTANAATSANGTGKICKWKQTDSKWNSIYSAKWKQGCAVTAIAIQIARTDLVTADANAKTFNKTTGKGFNPGTFAKAWNINKSLSVTWADTTKVVPGFKNVTTKNVLKSIDSKNPNRSSAGWHYYNATSKAQICKAMKYFLDKGYYPIIEGPGSKWASNKNSVHYVAVIKATTSDVTVIDPADGKQKSLFSVSVGGGKWTPANIEKCGIPKGYGCCRLYYVDESKKPASSTPSTPSTPTDPAAEYLAKCTKAANTYVSIKVSGSSSDYIKTLPCAAKTCDASKNVRKLVEGEILTATAIYKNTGGNYWYKVKADSDGKEGYVYGAVTVLNGDRAPKAACTGAPSISTTTPKYGNPYTISGTIKSTNLTIIAVSAGLRNASTDKNLQYKLVQNLNTKSYKLAGSPIDANLKFGKLPKGKGYIIMNVALSGKYIDGNTIKDVTLHYYPTRFYYTVK